VADAHAYADDEETAMPKTSRKSTGEAKRARIFRPATRVRKKPSRMQTATDDERHIDGCDVDFNESDVTPDTELPESTGGVEIVPTRRRTVQRRR